jgi:beta-mannanase
MHDVFEREGAASVRWVWSPNSTDVPAGNHFESYYPGSEYVDVLGLSGFNWGNTRPWSRWQPFTEIFSGAYRRICALGSQPVWFTELGCAPGGRKARWVTEMLAAIPRFPRLAAIIWFNQVKETDWRATHPAEVASSFAVAGH